MKNKPSFYLPFIAATLVIASSVASAKGAVRRISHPNGPATYVANSSDRSATIAVYSKGQGINATRGEASRVKGEVVRINRGRGQEVQVRSGR